MFANKNFQKNSRAIYPNNLTDNHLSVTLGTNCFTVIITSYNSILDFLPM